MGAERLTDPLRVVLDTNIVVSALLFTSGRLSWLRHQWQQGSIIPLVTNATAGELIRVLSYPKFRLSSGDVRALLGDFLPYCEVIEVPDEGAAVPEVRDPNDQAFLIAAVGGDAAYLVTGDADLLAVREQASVAVVTAAELRSILEEMGIVAFPPGRRPDSG